MKVPLLDLSGQYRKIKKEVLREVERVCDSQHYILGKNVSSLEEEIAEYCGVKFAVGVASGSDALLLGLMAAGIEAGDRVVTTPFTFFATAGSIARLGAVPVFVDIHPETYNVNPEDIENVFRKNPRRIRAVIPVHLFGQCADMASITGIAKKYGASVIEDAAQSIGAAYRGKRAGSLGDMGCFSFYPTKNLGCFGDGGIITTGSARTAGLLKMLRVHGSSKRYYHTKVGVNSRLDELQAAILRVKLKYLDAWNEGRSKNAGRYMALFRKAGLSQTIKLPYVQEACTSVFNQYSVLVEDRDRLRGYLAKEGVGTEVYYPLPLHLQKCFKYLGYRRGDFPVSEKVAKDILSLPIYPELTGAQQSFVVSKIASFYGINL